MVVSKKINNKKRTHLKILVSTTIIFIGILFTFLDIGGTEFAGFPSLGIWILFTGIISMTIALIGLISHKERIIDERMEHIGYKASRITTLILILTLFFVMVLDGIYSLSIRYYLFASFLICYYIFSYLITYKIIERKN